MEEIRFLFISPKNRKRWPEAARNGLAALGRRVGPLGGLRFAGSKYESYSESFGG